MVTTIATQDFARLETAPTAVNPAAKETRASVGFASTKFAHLPGSAVYEADVLVQLKANLAQLEDLHGRLQFMMGELSYLLRKV